MEWSGKEAFVSSSEKPFTVDGKEAGVLKNHGPLSFLKVRSGSFHKSLVYKSRHGNLEFIEIQETECMRQSV